MAKKNKWKKNKKKSVPLYIPPKRCHYGNLLVASKPVKIYGGGWSRGFEEIPGSIIIDCADVAHAGRVQFYNMDPPEGLRVESSIDFQLVKIKWPDMSAPALSRKFWFELVNYIIAENRPVIACCVGGHGRTGTALTIICTLLGLVPKDKCPVQWLRLKYCYNAVESEEQIDYVEWVTGRTVLAKQAKVPYVWPGLQSGKGRTWSDDKFNYGGCGY